MKRGLVLAGGGSRGAFSCGALYQLIVKEGLNFDYISGISVGSLHGAMLAQAQNADELKKYAIYLKYLWTRKIQGDYSIYNAGGTINLLWRDYLHDIAPLKNLLDTEADWARIHSSPIKLWVGAVSFQTGKIKYVNNHDTPPDIFKQYVLASSSMPLMFPPVEINGQQYFDGGLRDVIPLEILLENHNDLEEIHIGHTAVANIVPTIEKFKGAFSILGRTLDIIIAEVMRQDINEHLKQDTIDLLLKKRTNIRRGNKFVQVYNHVPLRQIIEDSLEFDKNKINELFRHGRQIAESTYNGD